MSRVIEFEYEGVPYTIELNRRAFSNAEKMGFSITEFRSHLVSQSEIIFFHGLLKSKPNMSPVQAEKLFEHFVSEFGLTDFVSFVAEEYNAFFLTTQSDSEKKPLNIKQR